MNKKKTFLLVICIILAMTFAFLGGNVFSKYLSEITGTGTAEIANWVFKVNGKEDAVQNINLLSTYHNETLINNKIAPGTSGSFNIVVDATGSEVGVEYAIHFLNESEKPENLIFIYDNEEYFTIQDLEKDLTGIINANDEEKKRTITIYWEWQYETGNNENEINQNDQIDTNNAKQLENYTFDINVKGIQVMPQ